MKISVFWFRRDLRLEDNTALNHALAFGLPVLPVFIFDENIIDQLPKDDVRISFIYESLKTIHSKLKSCSSSLLCLKGDPVKIWENLTGQYEIAHVFFNKDYEPYAVKRDIEVKAVLAKQNIGFHGYKDQVIFEENEIVKKDGKPYTVFTPYKHKWLDHFSCLATSIVAIPEHPNYLKKDFAFPQLNEIGFQRSGIKVENFDPEGLNSYAETRNFPSVETSRLSPHLRFGTISIRQVINMLQPHHQTFLAELIWREFFMQILFHFPAVVDQNFKTKYDGIQWRNDPVEFERWCRGKTGYGMVDAGMRQLNQTGYMHNRVRMVVASFLCKHLLIDWRWGEAYFAEKLIDFELASNNGNWQWAAGTGCDAAPYFRIFNPSEQLRKFDKGLKYVKKWVPEYGTEKYTDPVVDHKFARARALAHYKSGLMSKTG